MTSVIDATWAGFLGTCLGVGISSGTQLLSQHRDRAMLDRKERRESYAMFLSAANRGERAAVDNVALEREYLMALSEAEQLQSEFAAARVESERLKIEYDNILTGSEGRLEKEDASTTSALEQSSKKARESAERFKQVGESLKVSTAIIKVLIERKKILNARVNEFLIEMDRAIVLIQLGSRPHLAEVGEQLYLAIDNHAYARMSFDELMQVHERFTSLAKSDLL